MLTVLRSGMQTSVQDLGRPGYRARGIGLGGALDRAALRLANLLVGNDPSAAGLEIVLGQFQARFEAPCWLALTGADAAATLDGQSLSVGWCYPVRAGQQLKLGSVATGMRSYLAVSGGIAAAPILGSRSTDLKAGFGGGAGRALQSGDVLPFGEAGRLPRWIRGVRPLPFNHRVRALPGPEFDEFDEHSRHHFWQHSWQVSPQSNRMGYRLQGSTPLAMSAPREMLSHGLLPGVVQVPPAGQPIVLLADAQTTGGYPRIACVIDADLDHLAQLRPGQTIHFIPCTQDEALRAAALQARYFARITERLDED